MLKIGQNWGKIANYTPPKLNQDRHPWTKLSISSLLAVNFERRQRTAHALT